MGYPLFDRVAQSLICRSESGTHCPLVGATPLGHASRDGVLNSAANSARLVVPVLVIALYT
jgi:hypothetical protein